MIRALRIALLLLAAGCGSGEGGTPDWVTSATCAECHPAELAAWQGSHHDRAMEEASADSVLGDFDEATFDEDGQTVRFFRRDDAYFVSADGAEHRVRYTFGVDPLQQVLLERPGGRLQAFTIAWDTRPRESGGQRWFSLHPDEATPPGDVLHWAGLANRWNASCAHCHSTNLRKRFLPRTRSYDTQWSEIDVACEACHGPGGAHVAWARDGGQGAGKGLVVDLSRDPDAKWRIDPQTGIAQRTKPRTQRTEIEACAGCHSRRALVDEAATGAPYHDAHALVLLDEGLYQPDGQILDEVYVYGSFLQSRMYAAGVTCSDCHEPHSLALRADGDTVCARCHAPERFATSEHHGHAPQGEGASCIACHMPSRTYMQVDERHDHSFRVPRPDLSLEIGVSNACSDCHTDRDASWAVEALRARGATLGEPHYGETLHAARRGPATATAALLALARDPDAPGIVRATAVASLLPVQPDVGAGLRAAARDPDPLVRRAAAEAAVRLGPQADLDWLAPLLEDSRKSVRLEAARVLAGAALEGAAAEARDRALREYRDLQRSNADEPSAWVNLALVHAARGEMGDAEAAYRRGLEAGPWFRPAVVNLADLLARLGREAEAEQTLRRALEREPDSPVILHALGLSLVRQSRLAEALPVLTRAANRAPGNARFAYVHGVALHSAGRVDEAIRVLDAAHNRHPGHAGILEALAAYSRDAGRERAAAEYAARLRTLVPPEAEAPGSVR